MKDKLILPTRQQALWADAEVGVIIHCDLTSFHPGYDFRAHWDDPIPPSDFAPEALDTDQWIKTAKDMGHAMRCLWQSIAPVFACGRLPSMLTV